MKGDFSRDTFDPAKHFSRVLQQQGRVQLDADSNEQTAILLHYLRMLAADLIGPFAGPKGSSWGFEITKDVTTLNIGPGRYYVDGILCENERIVPYKEQKDYPNPSDPNYQVHNLVYLDVWERHITALEDDYIREKALGGPDTATRTQVVWQVRIDDGVATSFSDSIQPGDLPKTNMEAKWIEWIKRWQPLHRGCLRARVKRPEGSNDPCLTVPDAKYRGQENQLYRVEIHHDSSAEGGPTFKWSKDNGSIVSRVVEKSSDIELMVEKPLGFVAGNWVELSNDGQELWGQPGQLVRLLKVEGDRFTLESEVVPPNGLPQGVPWPTKVRRWDQRKNGSIELNEGAVPVTEGDDEINWIELENGIQIQFQPSSVANTKNFYRTGDYWLIPARVATGGIEWPIDLDDQGKPKLVDGKENPIPRAPFGIQHHYAPLAILKPNEIPEDRRYDFPTGSKMRSFGEEGMGGHPQCELPASPS